MRGRRDVCRRLTTRSSARNVSIGNKDDEHSQAFEAISDINSHVGQTFLDLSIQSVSQDPDLT